MKAARVYSDYFDVNRKLATTFGVTRDELLAVVREVVGARADTTEDDPLSAGGLQAYIHGTRNLRAVLKRVGWLRHRKDNIELSKHPDRDLMVTYQSVDLAGSETHNPQAISGKGAGAERAIEDIQPFLFTAEEMSGAAAPVDFRTGMWFFCVSVVGDDVRAEMSLPRGVGGGNFKGFLERIFIVQKGEWDKLRVVDDNESDAVEFSPVVKRK